MGLNPRDFARGPLLFVVSGPSGAGKTVVVSALCERLPIVRSVSATTRPPRPQEADGLSYYFLTSEAFEDKVEAGEFAEWARYGDHLYGTLRQTIDDALEEGHDLVLTIDVQGGAQIKARYPDAVLIFLLPPDVGTLRERLVGRGTETEQTFRQRIARLPEEVRAAAMYDYAVVNEDSIEETAGVLAAIIEAEHHRMTSERTTRCASVGRAEPVAE